MKSLTKNDLENLSKLPDDKWFEAIDLWPQVKRTDYSLSRLIQAGYVEKDVSDGPIHYIRYRKIKDIQVEHDTKNYPIRSIVEIVTEMMGHLSESERMEIMHHYCTHCGSSDTGCQCWNDE